MQEGVSGCASLAHVWVRSHGRTLKGVSGRAWVSSWTQAQDSARFDQDVRLIAPDSARFDQSVRITRPNALFAPLSQSRCRVRLTSPDSARSSENSWRLLRPRRQVCSRSAFTGLAFPLFAHSSAQPTRHHIFFGPGGGPGPAIVGFDQIAPLNSETRRVLIKPCAISPVSGCRPRVGAGPRPAAPYGRPPLPATTGGGRVPAGPSAHPGCAERARPFHKPR